MAPYKEAVYATLLMTDSYLPGALVLAHSLRDTGAKKARLAVLVTLETVSKGTLDQLKTVFDDIIPVNHIVNKTPTNLYLMDRPDLISTFTKIELWKQTQYRQIVYIDADVVSLRAPNELLQLDTDFAAVPDIGWPDCFNSGLMVLTPNMSDYYSLLALAQRGISFDGADQGLLNMHFRDWERLSFVFNCTPSGHYQYVPAYRHFQSSISLVHYIGHDKPWTIGRDSQHTGVYDELLGRWWASYDRHYRLLTTSSTTNQDRDGPRSVQARVSGEGGPSHNSNPSMPPPIAEAQADLSIIEKRLTDQPKLTDSSQQSDNEPTSIMKQRNFSAPLAEWNAAQAPPPSNSKPEASNFPSQIYQMSGDTNLFQPPTIYPEPPKDMYYQVPVSRPAPQKPAPIFPWEARAPKPTRVFLEEKQPEPAPEPELPTIPSATDESRAMEESPPTPPAPGSETDKWNTYNRTNAWDENPDIERYVQAIQQSRKGKVQVLHSEGGQPESRRPSMKLTDFPTEFERPSLPVTPAPVRRPSFWGEERDSLGDLPPAEGVPKQEDWNPVARLEELQRRQSIVLEEGPQSPTKELPDRKMPASASAGIQHTTEARPTAPRFSQPNFRTSSSTVASGDKADVDPYEAKVSA